MLLEVDVDRMRPLRSFIAMTQIFGVSLPRIGVDAIVSKTFAMTIQEPLK